MKRFIALIVILSMTLMSLLPVYAEGPQIQNMSNTFEFGGEVFSFTKSNLINDERVNVVVKNVKTKEKETCVVNIKESTVTIDGKVYHVKKEEYVDYKKVMENSFFREDRGLTMYRSSNYPSKYISTISFDLDNFIGELQKAATYIAGACVIVGFFVNAPATVAILTSIKSVVSSVGLAFTTTLTADIVDLKIKSDQYRTLEKQFTGMGNPVYLYKWANRRLTGRLTFLNNKTGWLSHNFGDGSWWAADRPY